MPVREACPLHKELSLWDPLQHLGWGQTQLGVRGGQHGRERRRRLLPGPVQDALDLALQRRALGIEKQTELKVRPCQEQGTGGQKRALSAKWTAASTGCLRSVCDTSASPMGTGLASRQKRPLSNRSHIKQGVTSHQKPGRGVARQQFPLGDHRGSRAFPQAHAPGSTTPQGGVWGRGQGCEGQQQPREPLAGQAGVGAGTELGMGMLVTLTVQRGQSHSPFGISGSGGFRQ